ncbi:MAG TPA: 4a-hydroxytetrahydrobiopterin dehydratase [Burkholderiales bacterium]|nr:4a-hydroxytetrahydrobiopterin dehydratase [Burkholderiales bacterium]
MNDLFNKRCKPCEGGIPALTEPDAKRLTSQIPGWSLEGAARIVRSFEFKNYYETIAFVNAIAWISHREDHHPDLEVGYKRCIVRYSTHAVNGLTENDFICAAKVNALVGE